ncbi:hypothetical protein GDO86_005149 [Hymenochirus boettgeri]|uniref:Solute carrier family 45 member 3 n=1 Tax=Hymenochirus boettgeri TaxID=247094 RepID=A0A8T2J6B3_9PIPI|nr:hypothetical protein GDO86_005149 [Hymenochirus boettgeri]
MTFCNFQWHLVLVNFMTCGLEICVAAGITYVPPILLEAGVEEQYMTMVLGIGPVLGLVLVPLIGSASDNCHSTFGRRRPFIWLLSAGVLLSLLIIPHADFLASYFKGREESVYIFLLIFGVGLLDCCVQVCFTPLEALLSDLCNDGEGCGLAFAMFSFMIGVGGCIGYLLSSVNWNYTLMSLYLGGPDECLFSILTLIFIISVLVTMKTSRETFYEQQQAMDLNPMSTSVFLFRGCCIPKWKLRSWTCNSLLCLLSPCWSFNPRLYHRYCRIPPVIKHLCATQLFSWMAVMSFMMFYTDFVGEGLYNGIPSAAPGTESRIRYDEGIRMGSLGLFLQCATSTFFSVFMNQLTKHFGSKRIYLASMITFTLSALVICLSQNIVLVTIMSSLTGFAYATLQTVPYTLICLYHKEKDVFMPKKLSCPNNLNAVTKQADYFASNNNEDGIYAPKGATKEKDEEMYISCDLNGYGHTHNKPFLARHNSSEDDYTERGIGLDFAMLDSAFLLSQVFLSLFMGIVVQSLDSVTVYIASSVIFGVFGIYLANQVLFDQRSTKTIYFG